MLECISNFYSVFQDSYSLCELTVDRPSNPVVCESPSSTSGYLSQESLLQLKKDLDVLVKAKDNNNVKQTQSYLEAEVPNKTFRQRLRQNMKKESKYQTSSLKRTKKHNSAIETAQVKSLPRMTKDNNGFSHLEWSASVPYNLAEEPDEVCGMKHSHSCQSMPGMTLEEICVQKSLESSPVPDKVMPSVNAVMAAAGYLHQIEEAVSASEEGEEEEETTSSHREYSSSIKENDSELTTNSIANDQLSSSVLPESDTAAFASDVNSIDQTIKELEMDYEEFSELKFKTKERETQEELSRKLEELREESRST